MKKVIIKTSDSPVNQEYVRLLEYVKTDILQTQLKAAMSVIASLTKPNTPTHSLSFIRRDLWVSCASQSFLKGVLDPPDSRIPKISKKS